MKFPPFQKSYRRRVVLEMPGFTLEPGRICGVLGANGSGKSTLARVLAGTLPPDGAGPVTPPGTATGYMPQRSWPFRMTVRQNLLITGGGAARAEELLSALGLAPLAGRRAELLSGGELARLALARVLMRPCRLLILDEPTAAMDIESTARAEELMQRTCRETGCALLLVTHSLQQARRVADDLLFLHRGRLLEQGPAEQVLSRPEHPETKRFLDFYGDRGREETGC